MDKAIRELNAEVLSNQFAVGSSKVRLAGRVEGFKSLHRQRADGEP